MMMGSCVEEPCASPISSFPTITEKGSAQKSTVDDVIVSSGLRHVEQDITEQKTLSPTVPFIPITEDISLTMPQASPNLPPRPEFVSFKVAHLCASNPFDGGDFWTYPQRCGWIVHAGDTNCHVLCPPGACHYGLALSEIPGRSMTRPAIFSRSDGRPVLASDKVAFFQAWLFFGVLAEMSKLCQLQIDVLAEFLVESQTISTASLNGLPGRWLEAAGKANRAGKTVYMEQILALARLATLMLSEEVNDGIPMFKYAYAECRVLHSMGILVRSIGLHLIMHTYLPGFSTTEEDGWGRGRISKSLSMVVSEEIEGLKQLVNPAHSDLEQQGWCASELDLFSPEEIALASLLPRPRIRDHSNCGESICDAYQTDEATYRTRHVEDGCSCDFVGVKTETLVHALSQNKVPKLLLTEDLKLRVVEGDEHPYIAFSHVWADGLGNPLSNALPQCQLRRLRAYANDLSRIIDPSTPLPNALPVVIWMDTLCIPVHPSAKLSRKKAIELLGKTFNEATAVLILDRELEIVDSITATFFALGVRILCSGWVKRLWTLQEATLASEARGIDKLFFQMRDGPFLYQKYDRDRKAAKKLDDRTTEIQAEERTLLIENGIMLLLGEQIPSVRAMRSMREGWSPFLVIHSAILRRATSKAEDVPVCIASLLGKNLSPIVAASGAEERMANFYLVMRNVPVGVLWLERKQVTRLGFKPFRWAPSSITSFGTLPFRDWPDGICDGTGFHIGTGGFLIAEGEAERYGLGRMLPFMFNIDSGDDRVLPEFRWDYSPEPVRTKEIPILQNMAFLLRPAHLGRLDFEPNVIVVSIDDTIDFVDEVTGEHLVEYVCSITGYLFMIPPGRFELLPLPDVYRVQQTTSEQRWCIT